MFVFFQSPKYRTDIDGLRAVAVIAVIIFHLGYLPGGYLGVDVFFVISGYLITGIIYHELHKGSFSMKTFYLRRIRRIIPLSLFICLVALVTGVMVMLPDDLENLSQSVIATSFFSNNILQAFTTRNYWDVVNEFKPLMHTWSLGVEEQYYFVYPLLLALVFKRKQSWVMPVLVVLTLASLALFLGPFRDYFKFYLLPFRFFELALGGIAAILLKGYLFRNPFAAVQLALLLGIMCFGVLIMPPALALILTVVLTVMVLSTANDHNKLTSWVLQNRVSVAIGLISYSLYMWHQLLLAFGRYLFFHEPGLVQILMLVVLMFGLSTLSYLFVEQPFRKRNLIKTRDLLLVLGALFLVTNAGAAYVVLNAGVVRDVPELDVKAGEAVPHMHAAYNDRIYQLDKDFEKGEKLKVLVLGDSFARDWANVLLESAYAEQLDVTYIYNVREVEKVNARAAEAALVFYSRPNPDRLETLDIDPAKLYAVGTKNFGISNGIFYNYRGDDYFEQRTRMEDGFLEINAGLKERWGERFLDYIGKVIDEDLTVPVFTPAQKFISADCRHLTRPGAQYFASLFQEDLGAIFAGARP